MAANLCWAQRNINMEAVLEAPLNGSTWMNGGGVPLVFKLTNHGPDNLVVGDSLFFLPNIGGVNVQFMTLTEDVTVGATMTLIDQVIDIQAPSTPYTADLCITLFDPNSTGLSIGNNPVTVSYDDNDTTNNTACASITFVSDTAGTGINNLDDAGKEPLVIYPNPTADRINFAVTVEQPVAARATIFDMMGRLIMTHEFGSLIAGKEHDLMLDVTELPEGMYSVTLYAGERSFVGKVTVQH